MRRLPLTVLLIALLPAGSLPGEVHAAYCAEVVDEVARACCERSLPTDSMRQEVQLTVADERGTVSNLAAKIYWKRFERGGARARIDLTDPPREAGTVVLLTEREADDEGRRREPEVVVYKPGERRDRLVTVRALSGEMFGTDISYEDFAYFYGTDAQIDIVRRDDEELDGRPVMVLEATPKDADAAFDRGAIYTRVVTRFDSERCVPLITRFYEREVLRKELVATPDSVREQDGRFVPYEQVMHDRLEQSRTILNIDQVEFDPNLRESFFQRSALQRGR